MAINALARQTLLKSIAALFSVGEHAVPLAAKGYENWNVFDFAPDVQLKNNGFGKDAKTPLFNEGAYPWREDALDLWGAIQSYVREFVQVFYKGNDSLVAEDTELQAWRLEVLALHPNKPFPPIDTQEKLINVMSIIIWIASAGHASVNFNQVRQFTNLSMFRPLSVLLG
jgi:linoleate 9S-lipoxygenase